MTDVFVRGPKFVSGAAIGGQLVLRREDGSTAVVPGVIVMRGRPVDNGDGTYDIEEV